MLVVSVTKSPYGVEPEPGTVYQVSGAEPQILGRSKKSAVRIRHQQISRQHLAFLPREDGWYIKDLGSKNGTTLNGGQLTEERKLQAGDRFRIGQFLFWITELRPPAVKPPETQEEQLVALDPAELTDAEETTFCQDYDDQ